MLKGWQFGWTDLWKENNEAEIEYGRNIQLEHSIDWGPQLFTSEEDDSPGHKATVIQIP